MRSRPAATLAVAALLVLSGCTAFAPGGGPGVTETVTPVPVDPSTPAPATETPPTVSPSGDLPAADGGPTVADAAGEFPGIAANGSVDAAALFDAHVAYLSERSYRLEWSRLTSGGSGAVTESFRRSAAVQNATTYLRRDARPSLDRAVETYGDPTGTYRRPADENASVMTGPPTVDARERFTGEVVFEVSTFAGQGHPRVDIVERGDRRYARLFTTNAPRQITEVYAAYSVRNFTATVWVAPEGYVRSIQYAFELRRIGERISVQWRFDYVDVGRTTVERPDWVPRESQSATASVTDSPESPGTAVERNATAAPRGRRTLPATNLAASAP